MKIVKIAMLYASLAAGLTTRAVASLYDITYDDGNGDIGTGQIDVVSSNNNFFADSGFLDVTSGGAIGFWTLYTAGGSTTYPGYIYSPSGAYIYNNAVYPAGQNPQYPDTNPLLDYYGLLFTQNSGNELNLWGNADGTYTLGGNINGYQNFNVNIGLGGTPTAPVIITPVPEPSTLSIAAAFLPVLIGVSAFRVRRQLP